MPVGHTIGAGQVKQRADLHDCVFPCREGSSLGIKEMPACLAFQGSVTSMWVTANVNVPNSM